ncbi:E3 ubiquitin ligase PARAQUAT TOLERANCE 3-like [Durio zibethinus]|uniref:E3 ubiquitin ligase PARAQUAT TOLERANCE 3-like n=1 Tax=Durio zibethinus TaxID=66656 RepID=A0A6P5WQM8_DURZI|nr:E3 ubiquitin ligase PARAQUAT TOLERANCE 3-like [Durio zibethinus]
MAVLYYKFKTSIDGPFISVSALKAQIFSSKRYGNGKDFDLLISDARTYEQFADGCSLIPANSSVLICRVPKIEKPVIIGEKEKPKIENIPSSVVRHSPEEEGFDFYDFGLDFDSVPTKSTVNPSNSCCKEDKIDVVFKFLPVKGFGKRQIPPQGYVYRHCKVTGHYIQYCPTNGDPNFDFKRVKPTTGISKKSVSTSSGSVISYASASTLSSSVGDNLPPELHYPLCKKVMKDAVLAKCCFASLYDKCIRDRIVSKSVCVCPWKIVSDDVLANMPLRDTINRILNQSGDSTSNSAGTEAANMKRKHLLAAKEIQQKRPDLG